MLFDFSFLPTLFQSGLSWFAGFWWLWLFILVALVAAQIWKAYIQEFFRRTVPYVVLELRVPREVRKTPRAMEQIFTTIHSLRNSCDNFEECWWDGEVPQTFSCEMASYGGQVHFYMRVPRRHKSIVEAALYSQYQDVEVVEVEDYTGRFPATFREIDATGYNIFGNELILAKEDVYPIRTYVDFEAVEETKELDPISGVLELLASVRPREEVWLQFVLQPLVDAQIPAWVKKGEEEIDKIKAKAQPAVDPQTGLFRFTLRSPTEEEAMKAIDRTISKPGFFTVVRWIYFSPKEIYTSNFGQRGLFSALNHYATETFNKFRYSTTVWTRAALWYWPHLFPKRRAVTRKNRILSRYRRRVVYDEIFMARIFELGLFDWGLGPYKSRYILNTEELATIYHLPTFLVMTGPMMHRMESRRVGPPAGMAIYGEEGEEVPGV